LQTNHTFQKALPQIHAKLLAAAWQADEQQQWGLLTGKQDCVHARCVEYHEGKLTLSKTAF
jgi:hypothetical protein